MAVFGDMIPFIDGVIRFGTGSVAMEIGLLLSLVTIARDDSKETGETPRSIPPPEPPTSALSQSGREKRAGPAATGTRSARGGPFPSFPPGRRVPKAGRDVGLGVGSYGRWPVGLRRGVSQGWHRLDTSPTSQRVD